MTIVAWLRSAEQRRGQVTGRRGGTGAKPSPREFLLSGPSSRVAGIVFRRRSTSSVEYSSTLNFSSLSSDPMSSIRYRPIRTREILLGGSAGLIVSVRILLFRKCVA